MERIDSVGVLDSNMVDGEGLILFYSFFEARDFLLPLVKLCFATVILVLCFLETFTQKLPLLMEESLSPRGIRRSGTNLIDKHSEQ